MTRQEMEEVINGGGSVLHEGRLHTQVSTLPSKSELAKTEEEKAASAKEIDDQIAELIARRAALDPKKGSKSEKDKEPANQENKDESDFPEGFSPRAKSVFEKLGKTYAEVSAMNREDLIAVSGIAETTADEILAFVNKK